MTHEAVILTTSLVLGAIYGGVLLSLLIVHLRDRGALLFLFNRAAEYEVDATSERARRK